MTEVNQNFINWIIATFGTYQHPHSDEFVVDCPNCGAERRCSINPTKRVINCYRCGGDGLIHWLTNTYAMTPGQISNILEGKKEVSVADFENIGLGGGFPTTPVSVPDDIKPDLSDVDIQWIGYGDMIADSPPVLKYLGSRGFTLEDARNWRLGYSPTGKYSGRLIIPVFEDEKLVYFQGRALYGQEPKYLNPGKAQGVQRDSYVFHLDAASAGIALRQSRKPLVICEGAFNAMSVGDNYRAIALFGKHLSSTQRNKIAGAIPTTTTIIVAFDFGAESESLSVIKQFASMGFKNLWRVNMPDKRDLNDWVVSGYEDIISHLGLNQSTNPAIDKALSEIKKG